ncbi:MAG: Na+/H+ antiporter subunit E [Desulfobacterales bacterium]
MSSLFILNLFLAAGFSVIMGQLNVTGFVAGFVIGYAALWVTRPLYARAGYFERVPRLLKLAGTFLWQLLVSNFRVLWDVVTPRHISSPAVIGVPLDAETDFEIMLVANIISLTPGTLSLDVSGDRKMLYVHMMFLDDADAARREIKEKIEKRVLEAIR